MTKRLKCGIILTNQKISTYSKEVVNIWDEMSYNYYWAYRDLSLSQRCDNEPDDVGINNYQEQEEDN